ncbi:MAG: TonB-dependent receptor [Opitutaceae bacterium]|nr:TonB-dependent receptor [Opitutaceae bacterium]
MNVNPPRLPPFARLSLWIALALAAVTGARSADDAARGGTITGRVQNLETGRYLNNAQVSVRGSAVVVSTDESGTYRLAALPPGSVTLRVFYTGLEPQEIAVDLAAGQTVERNVDLRRSVSRTADGAVKLDALVVSTGRETDGEAIAINEQRFAPNIKNVVSADALGDVTDGNVGEFLKFLPGVTAEYDGESGSSVASIAVRGFPTSMAVVSGDGMQMANTGNATGSSRVFQFTQVSMNNITRLEVTKVPTPSTPADSLAGSINMVSKSAFERKNAQLRYSVSLSANHPFVDLQKTPHVSDENVYKVRPGATFDYTLPLSNRFGLVVTGGMQTRYMWHRVGVKPYNVGGTGTGASIARPYLQQYQLQGSPRINERSSAGLKADWRVSPGGVLSFSAEASRFVSDRTAASTTFNAGTNATPTVASGVRLTYGEDFTSGATGRGAVTLMGESASVRQQLDTRAGNLRYRFDNGDWRVEASLGVSSSTGGYQDTKYGRFRSLGVSMRVPVRVAFTGIGENRPRTIEIFDNNNQPVDYFNLNNYQLTSANSTPRYIEDALSTAKFDLRKNLRLLPFTTAVQVGGAQRVQRRDVRRETLTWTYAGPDGNTATVDTPTPYGMTTYVNQEDLFGFRGMPWVSVHKAWAAYEQNPALWTRTPAQLVAEELFRINNSEWLEEGVSSLYLQAEAGLFQNRLRVLTGVRYEKTDTKGQGVRYDPAAVWLRNANGSFARNAAGARIRRSEAGAVGSMEELLLTRGERGMRAGRTYDGYFPSLHVTYQARENLLVRVAYAKTYGRPDFTNIVPNTTVDEFDLDGAVNNPSLVRGRLTVRNTGLRPWTADNYDLSLEYYTDQGGLLSAGVFLKEIKNFFGSAVQIATPEVLDDLGFGPEYAGWDLSTQFNLSGIARVKGVEFNLRHSLAPLGVWGRPFQAFANATKLELQGSRQASFGGFIPESANWGLQFKRNPVTAMVKWNYRGLQKGAAVAAVDGFEYSKARTTLDVNLEYDVTRSVSLYFNAQNIFNVPTVLLRYGDQTPEYARRYHITRYGAQLTLGVKGAF